MDKLLINILIHVVIGWVSIFALHSQPVNHSTRIKIFTTRAIATVLDEIAEEFEKTTNYKFDVTTDIAIKMVRRIQQGESFDILVASPQQIDTLIKQGKIIKRTNLAQSGIGVAVRAGSVKPDISSVKAFKNTLIKAKSVAYLKEGQSGIYLAALIERLGLTKALNSKVVRPDTDIVSKLVANGEIELGLVVITQIKTTEGVELVGPLPRELQSYIIFAAGVSTNSRVPAAANQLIKFLTSPRTRTVMKFQGMEPWSYFDRSGKPSVLDNL